MYMHVPDLNGHTAGKRTHAKPSTVEAVARQMSFLTGQARFSHPTAANGQVDPNNPGLCMTDTLLLSFYVVETPSYMEASKQPKQHVTAKNL